LRFIRHAWIVSHANLDGEWKHFYRRVGETTTADRFHSPWSILYLVAYIGY